MLESLYCKKLKFQKNYKKRKRFTKLCWELLKSHPRYPERIIMEDSDQSCCRSLLEWEKFLESAYFHSYFKIFLKWTNFCVDYISWFLAILAFSALYHSFPPAKFNLWNIRKNTWKIEDGLQNVDNNDIFYFSCDYFSPNNKTKS